MALDFGDFNIFKGIFKVSPEDNQALLSQGQRWRPEDIGGGTTWDFQDEFETENIDPNKWTTTEAGVTATITQTGGICKLEGKANNDLCYMIGLQGWSFATITKIILYARIRPNVSANDDNQMLIGLSSDAANPTADNIFWISYTTTGQGTDYYKTLTEKNSTETTNATAIPEGAWSILRIEASSSSVKFYKDNVLMHTHTTNIPDDVAIYPYFRNYVGEDATYSLEVDYVRVKIEE